MRLSRTDPAGFDFREVRDLKDCPALMGFQLPIIPYTIPFLP